MYRVETTAEFDAWIDSLRDASARAKIATRILRVQSGLLGDWKTAGDGVSELRIDHGPGYRLYYTIRGQTLVIVGVVAAKVGQKILDWLAGTWAMRLQVGTSLLIVVVGAILSFGAWRTLSSLA